MNETLSDILVLQQMLPIRSGPSALHLQMTLDIFQESYLSRADEGDIEGG